MLFTLLTMSCAYYNTFFNAEESYRIGMEKNEEAKLQKSVRKNPVYFKKAITKSWSVINQYGDSSSWADDALFLIGKSHYQLDEFEKARDIFEQFLKKYLKSEYIPNVQLWLGKTYLKEQKVEEALKIYTDILESQGDNTIKSQAHLNLGDLYFEAKDYENAIDNYKKCLDLSDDSKQSAEAMYKLADSYFKNEKYDAAIDAYKSVLQSDAPLIRQYTSIKSMVDAYLKKGNMEEATTFLKNSLHDIRFKKYYSLLASKLANIYEFQGEYDFAIENYYDVMKKYPRQEGAALAAFYAAQLYEFQYGQFDSAKINYDRVRKIYNKSEAAAEALKRSKLLANYLEIHVGLLTDLKNLYKLEQGDSTLEDSLITGQDTIEVKVDETIALGDSSNNASSENAKQENSQKKNTGFNSELTGIADNLENGASDKKASNTIKKIKNKKIAIIRTPEEVRKSYKKNSYRLAEYFLINYANYDSAEVLFNKFISNFSDSLLSPKAYYSLYFIYNSIDDDSTKADSVRAIIKNRYGDTIYGRKLLGLKISQEDQKEELVKRRFKKAEQSFSNKDYGKAIDIYTDVASKDSGSVWAVKSLYAAAYISEVYLKNNEQAYKYYTQLVKSYPSTKQGSIAKLKTTPLPKVKIKPEQTSEEKAKTVTAEFEKKHPKIKDLEAKKRIIKDFETPKKQLPDDK